MRPKAFLRCLFLFLVSVAPAAVTLGADDPLAATCKEFVYLDEERLTLDNQPFGLKGVNLTTWIGADPSLPPDGGGYFLIPYQSYRPQNFSLPTRSWQSHSQGCVTESACRSMLINEHVSRIANLGANSVRLVGMGVRFRTGPGVSPQDLGKPYFPATCLWRQPGDENVNCDMDLTNPVHRARYIEILREAINILGDHGLRTILHTSGGGAATDEGFENYLDILRELSQELANEPYLLAYDPMNEPEWFYDGSLDDSSFDNACNYLPGNRELCKGTAQQVSKAWFDALTLHDPRHFVTIGLANPYRSTRVWDPYVLWDHFTSYHVYADGLVDSDEWLDNNGFSESEDFANQIYLASLGGCGRPCPYVGQFDGANCLVAQGQAGQAGSITGGGFYYAPRTSGNACPGGTLEAGGCKVGEYEPGRDVPWTTTAPVYYVDPSPNISTNGGCPRGTTFDGANCKVAQGPPGATGFLADGAFYYQRFTGNQEPCAPGHVDEGTRCRVAYVPTVAGPPFIMDKALFYVERVSCGPRKPLHFGEIGFNTYRDGVTDDPCPFPNDAPDDIGCLLFTAPPGRSANYDSSTRTFSYHWGAQPCEVGFSLEGKWCKLKANTAKNVLLRQPLYYVEPINGQCPNPGTTPDSIGCLVAQGPIGKESADGYLQAQPFAYQGGFYYGYLDPEGVHCELSSQDDTRNCFVAPIPPGYTPIITTQAYFYRQHCHYDGSDADAVDFLVGGITPNWPGVVPYSHSCGFQGLHWWSFGDVNHGDCRETISLYAQWDTRLPYTPLDPSWMVEKGHVPTFRQGLDFTASPPGKCEKPTQFNSAPDRRTTGGGKYTFHGTVKDQFGTPIANAVVRAWERHPTLGFTYSYWTTTDPLGKYEVETRYCLHSVSASAFGYELSDDVLATGYDPGNCTLAAGSHPGPKISIMKLVPAGIIQSPYPPLEPELLNPTLLDAPSTRRVACRNGSEWVVQP